jgi:hypothetical protein
MLPISFYKVSITLPPKPDKDTTKNTTNQFPWWTDAKTLNIQLQSNQVTNLKDYMSRSNCFSPEMKRWFNILKSINKIQYLNRIKDKNHMIISTDALSCLWLNWTSLHDKNPEEIRLRRILSQHIEGYR